MSRPRLSPEIISKIAGKISKEDQYVREQVSKRARKENLSSEVALVNWAKELEIPTSAYIRKLGPTQQAQVYSQPHSNNSGGQKSQTFRIIQFGKSKDRFYNQWWVQWFVVGLLIATISGTLSEIAGAYFTNLLRLTKP